MPYGIWESFEQRYDVKILEWYGAVEGGLAYKPIGQGPVGSFGKPAPGLEMKILDESDNECPPGVPGEICSRPASGESAKVEYHENPDASEKKTRGGWLRSGTPTRKAGCTSTTARGAVSAAAATLSTRASSRR